MKVNRVVNAWNVNLAYWHSCEDVDMIEVGQCAINYKNSITIDLLYKEMRIKLSE